MTSVPPATEPDPRVYPPALIDLHAMNRVIRHRLRNLCAGMSMALDKIAEDTREFDPSVASRCQVMNSEFERLQHFTRRMDLVFDRLPPPDPLSLYELLSGAGNDFGRSFPFCSIEFDGPQADLIVKPGTWVKLALNELLANAGQAAGAKGAVQLAWLIDGQTLEVRVVNDCDEPVPNTDLLPPRPFAGARGRHDGMGLAIAYRLCQAMDATLTLDTEAGTRVAAAMSVPLGD